MKIIVFEQDSVVSVISVAPGNTVAEVARRAVPRGLKHYIMEPDDLPSKDHRSAWRLVDGRVVIDATIRAQAMADKIREKRDALLSASDFRALPDYPNRAPWVTYRAALRDLTDQEGFPSSVTWPDEPGG